MWCHSSTGSSTKVTGSARISKRIMIRTTMQSCIIFIITLLVILSTSQTYAKVTKKSGKDLSTSSDTQLTKPRPGLTNKPLPTTLKKLRSPATSNKLKAPNQRAIIAIEIVDPNDNSTKKRNGKRTIESSLGYGYQPSNYFPVSHKPPRYEVYKYSQEDIPPYHGPKSLFTGESSHIEIQKSIRYDLGSSKPELVSHHPKSLANYRQNQQPDHGNQYYSPGTILYSSLDQHGHLGGLSQQVPSHPSNHHAGAMVPVIILRVFTNQLTRPGSLHPNLPQSHPYAGLNDIDLQSLLNRYVTQHSGSTGYHQAPEMYYQPQPQPQQQYYQPQHYQTQENYPDDLHTKVIFHNRPHSSTRKYPQMVQSPGLTQYRTKPKEIRVHVPENVFSSIQVQEHDVVPQVEEQHQSQSHDDGQQHQSGGYYYYPSQNGQHQQQETYYQQPEEQEQHYQYQQQEDVPQETLESVDHPSQNQEQPQQQYQYVSQEEYAQSQQQQYDGTIAQEHAHQDVNPDNQGKVYNYHAHGQLGASQTDRESKKKRKASRVVPRRPLVLAPKVLDKHLERDHQ